MQPKVVAHSVLAVMLLAGCDVVPEGTKTLDPSGLRVATEAIVYHTNERDVPWASTEPNPCNGDAVSVQGTSHFVIQTGFDATGGFHYSSNVVSKGTGVGAPSGKAYKINEHFKFMDQTPGQTEGYVIRELGQLTVNGPQSADDYSKFILFKITVTPDGEPTAIVENSYTKCGA